MIPFELPEYSADWWPIYLEPVPGSGERITIGVAAIGMDRKRQVRNVLPKSALTMMYGEHSTGLMAVVVQTLTSIQNQLDNNVAPANIQIPFGGIFLGDQRDGLSDDISGIFDQAIRLTSSLGVTAFGEAKGISEVAQVFAEWSRKVRESVLQKHAGWEERFEKNIKVQGSKSARFSYLHHSYAANFGVIRPRKAQDTRALKIKLFDLELLRRQHPITITDVEVLIGVPTDDRPDLTSRDVRNVNDNFEFIYQEGKARNVTVKRFDTARDVAHYLESLAA